MSLSFSELLSRFRSLKAIVVGDVMLDEYVFGKISRVSQEAPVMVVRQTSTLRVPGGAANVGKNAAAMGASVTVLGVRGADDAGEKLEESLQGLREIKVALIRDQERVTTRKTRIVANHSHQVLRIDDEVENPLSEQTTDALLTRLEQELEDCAVLILSDYVKGVLTPNVVSRAIALARDRSIPVIANAKPQSIAHYAGATLVSMNRPETARLMGAEPRDREDAAEMAHQISSRMGIERVLITLGEDGMTAAGGGDSVSLPAVEVEAYDAAGAGDTVIATVGLGMAACGFQPTVFHLAAQTSAKVIQHVGVAVPTPEDLRDIEALDGSPR